MKRSDRQLALYLSAPHQCSYLPDRQSNTLFVDPDTGMDMANYSEMLRFGFRRSGRIVYAPRCEFCTQCVSVRIPVNEFEPRRIQRRIARLNADIDVREQAPGFHPNHYELDQRYTSARHEDGDMADASPEDYLAFLTAPWCNTTFMEFWLDRTLAAVAVTDVTDHGLSAVYTFFDPDLSSRSLGTLAILRQIEHAQRLDLDYVYLGYWIQEARKMAYKVDFRPIELWRAGRWERLAPGVLLK